MIPIHRYCLFLLLYALAFYCGYQWRKSHEPLPAQITPIPDSIHAPINHSPYWPKKDKYGHWEADKG